MTTPSAEEIRAWSGWAGLSGDLLVPGDEGFKEAAEVGVSSPPSMLGVTSTTPIHLPSFPPCCRSGMGTLTARRVLRLWRWLPLVHILLPCLPVVLALVVLL